MSYQDKSNLDHFPISSVPITGNICFPLHILAGLSCPSESPSKRKKSY